jgi:hypothetical protein
MPSRRQFLKQSLSAALVLPFDRLRRSGNGFFSEPRLAERTYLCGAAEIPGRSLRPRFRPEADAKRRSAPHIGVRTIRLVELYLPEAMAAAGGVEAMDRSLRAANEEAKAVMATSRIPDIRFELVWTGLAPEGVTDLGSLQQSPEVAAVRKFAGADVVGLCTESGRNQAYMPVYDDEFLPEWAFYTWNRPNTLHGAHIHELCHVLGCRHDTDPLGEPYPDDPRPWAAGYHDFSVPFATIMDTAMTPDKRYPPMILTLSNPNCMYRGFPVGSERADNARMARYGADFVSRYHLSL